MQNIRPIETLDYIFFAGHQTIQRVKKCIPAITVKMLIQHLKNWKPITWFPGKP